MWCLGSQWQDEAALANAWRAAQPFPHLVLDGLLPEADLPRLLELLDEESVDRYEGDIFAFEATPPEPRSVALRTLRDEFGATFAAPLSRITGKDVRRADMRAYAYRVGHYLLPHTDHQEHVKRALAYAFYLPTPTPPSGGELELYACELADGAMIATTSAKLVTPAPNRLVVFDVGDATLHQVREVVAGLRLSLAGWFYP